MAVRIKSGGFVPLSPRVGLVGLETNELFILEDGLRTLISADGELQYCTSKRAQGPIFNAKGRCVNGHRVQAVNYVETVE